jgi:hypothetical protein
VDGVYPLAFTALNDATVVPVAANGGSASYDKFSVPADAQALLKFGPSAAPRNGDLTFMLVRKLAGITAADGTRKVLRVRPSH